MKTALTHFRSSANATSNSINNWRIRFRETQLVSQTSAILSERRPKFWSPLLKSLNLSSDFNLSIFHQILNRIEAQPRVCFKFFKWANKNLNFTPDLRTKCRLIRILLDSGLLKPGKHILLSLIQDYPPAKILPLLVQHRKSARAIDSSAVLNSAIECYCDKKMHLPGLQVYHMATGQGSELTVDTCNALLSLLTDNNETRIAWGVYSSMIRNGVSENQQTWYLIARIFSRDGKFDRVSKILDMGIHSPSIFNLMVELCCKRGDFNSAFAYVGRMCSQGIEPTLSTYSSILDGACKYQNKEVIVHILCLILDKGFLPLPVICHYDSIIQNLCNSAKTHAVSFFYKKACDEKIELQHGTYECMFKALLCDESRVNDAIELFNIIQGNKILISSSSCNKFVNVLCSQDPSDAISRLLVDSIANGLCSDFTEVCKYISKLCRLGEWRDAEELLNLALDRGCLIDSGTCGIMVRHYCSIRKLDSAILLHDKLVELKGFLDLDTYDVLLALLLKEKKVEAALNVFDNVRKSQILSGSSYIVMIRGLCHEKEMREAMKLHDEMMELGLKPDGKAYKRLISAFM